MMNSYVPFTVIFFSGASRIAKAIIAMYEYVGLPISCLLSLAAAKLVGFGHKDTRTSCTHHSFIHARLLLIHSEDVRFEPGRK